MKTTFKKWHTLIPFLLAFSKWHSSSDREQIIGCQELELEAGCILRVELRNFFVMMGRFYVDCGGGYVNLCDKIS